MFDDRDEGRTALTQDEAQERLGSSALVAALEGSLSDMKLVRDQCLSAGIPALVGCPGGGAVTS
jgi:hypothetical protein